MIRFEQVSRRFGEKYAVRDLDLHVDCGEVFAFLGPNGAGKTTTIRMLSGLLLPSAGTIFVDGFDVTRQPREAKRRMGFVPDQPELYDKLTGREFLQFVGQLRGVRGEPLDQAIESVTRQFDLRAFADQLTESYSHGMKQRVAFAAALVHDPVLLVLDEPMVGLDPKSMRLVKDLLRQRAAQGNTVFLSTHTLAMAEEIAHRIGVIHRGRLLFVGSFQQLRHQMDRGDGSLEDLYLALTDDGEDWSGAPAGQEAT